MARPQRPQASKLVLRGLRGGRVERVSINMKWYFTYVLLSKKDGKLYMGWTFNLKERMRKHNEGKVVATRDRRPLELIYFEARRNREKAIAREKYLKSGFGRRYLKTLVK
jgi:putative endonuclease